MNCSCRGDSCRGGSCMDESCSGNCCRERINGTSLDNIAVVFITTGMLTRSKI